MSGVVTISASFGASGNVVGRAVAERLGIPFIDRAVPVAVAERLSVPIHDVLAHDEQAPSAFHRLARAFAYSAMPFGPEPPPSRTEHPDRFRFETERILRHIADTTGGVVLGRVAMVVLRNRPDVLRVRLDGPVDERIAAVMRAENLSETAARAIQRDVDGAREAYARVFYRAHQSDLKLYHVVLDPTSLGVEVSTAAIVEIAQRHLARWLPTPEDEPGPPPG